MLTQKAKMARPVAFSHFFGVYSNSSNASGIASPQVNSGPNGLREGVRILAYRGICPGVRNVPDHVSLQRGVSS